jgi:hypothetical protein
MDLFRRFRHVNSPTLRPGRPTRSLIIHELEQRAVPAGRLIADFSPDGVLRIEGTADGEVIRLIHRDGSVAVDGAPISFEHPNGSVSELWSVARAEVTRVAIRAGAGDDTIVVDDASSGSPLTATLWGGDGSDVIYGGPAAEQMVGGPGHDTLYGGPGDDRLIGAEGDDWLHGDDGADRLDGQAGDDNLRGGSGDDKLYGAIGTDWVYGEDGDDWLDAGSGWEYADGGAGTDFNAHVWSVGGATWTDVRQGDGPTCWLNASMASAALRGVDFDNRISYLGNDRYLVGLYNTAGLWQWEMVRFAGDTLGADTRLDPTQEGEFWHVLVQRAFLESRGLSVHRPPPNTADDALQAFTGRDTNWNGRPYGGPVPAGQWNTLVNALAAGRNVVADTRDSAGQLSTGALAPWHMYTVVEATGDDGDRWVTLRNPWGTDGPRGIVQVSWGDFRQSMDGIYVN